MKKVDYLQMFAELFDFNSFFDEKHNEYIMFAKSGCNSASNIDDRTAFEAISNHVHLLDNLSKEAFEQCVPIAELLGKALLHSLQFRFPEKRFVVYVSLRLHDSMIIRFHQKWDGETPYYIPSDFSSPKERVFSFEQTAAINLIQNADP